MNDVTLACSKSPANPNLSSTLSDSGEHDIHDPNATNNETDRCDRSQDDVKDLPDLVSLSQQFQGNDDVKVRLRTVSPLQRFLHDFRCGDHILHVTNFQCDLTELHLLSTECTAESGEGDVTDTNAEGAQRDVNILVEILPRHTSADCSRSSPRTHDADDGVTMSPRLDDLSQRVFEREQRRGSFCPQHADVGHLAFILIRQKATTQQLQMIHFGIFAR